MLEGGCFCKAIRYEAAGVPFNQTICHCTDCRGTTGAPCVAWFSVQRAEFRLLSGDLTYFQSSSHARRGFCARCGTQLTFEETGATDLDITTCSLDAPEAQPPRDHTYARSKLGWLRTDDGLPAFPTTRASAED
jgi:hypothetical protein